MSTTEPFTRDLDDLVALQKWPKGKMVHHLKKNFVENVHFVRVIPPKISRHGGHNKKVYMLTENAYNLLKNSYNLRNRYLPEIYTSGIMMCIENQTIGFINNVFYIFDGAPEMYRCLPGGPLHSRALSGSRM
jgi:hypothetical protein